jgi:two-component system, chemotaxis family, CheB/CheR fusion protein
MGKKTGKRASRTNGEKETEVLPAPVAEQKGNARKMFPIVAIGASAGGVEASTELLRHLSPDLGMAFIFIHHLSRSYDSQLPHILQRETSMPVLKAIDGMELKKNSVFVIPPDAVMRIEKGKLSVQSRNKTDVYAIDYFMTSLASSYQHNAIGILLSGTASDGTLGLKAIKLEGGICFAQDETARHRQMPDHAAHAGYVDYVLPPRRIAEELASLIKHKYAVTSPNDELDKNQAQIKKILSIVQEKFDVDFFSHYKRTTVNRRIIRRMAVNNIESFEDYTKKLRADNREVDALYNDFLINVTSFFREPVFYAALKKDVFPHLVKARKGTDPIRIWIPGCASGEEAYSTAITITEFLESKKLSIPVQIFSTDLDEKAIAKARAGIYPRVSMEQISTARVQKFFTKIDGHYQISKPIRDMCVFSVHNLMKDPPFSRIDLVSCQNVLIYLEAVPQRKILQAFHYALKLTGFLLLGKSETIGNATDLYQLLDTETKLYRKKHLSNAVPLDFFPRPASISIASHKLIPDQRTEADVESEFDKILLSRYVPTSVLVNKDLEILRFRGATSPFFQPASGKASLNLLKMVKEELIFDVRGLFQKARKSNVLVSKHGISTEAIHESISIDIAPLKSGKDLYYLVVFKIDSSEIAPVKEAKTIRGNPKSRMLKLEQALKEAREQIRTTTEDFDVAREELQSANEEILSSNEELQSINEELETSKEELQSANEELTTINEELQNRLEALKLSHDYNQAILETIHGPLLVVSSQMRVRTANKAFYDFFKLSPEETDGEFLYDLGKGEWDIPALKLQLRDLFPKKIQFKDFEITHEFPGIGLRVMIINAHWLSNAGSEAQILLAFHDITQFRQNEQNLREARQQLKLALEGGSVGTWGWDLKTNIISGSREQGILYGFQNGEYFTSYNDWLKSVYPEDVDFVKQNTKRSIAERKPLDIEFRIVQDNGRIRWVLAKANAYYDANGEPERMMGVNIDITERKQAIEALAESEKRFHRLSDHAPVMIWMTDTDQNCNFVNKTWLDFTGKTMDQEVGNGWYNGIHADDKEKFVNTYNEAYQKRNEFKADYRLKRADGEYRWVMAHGVPRYTNDGTFIGYIGTSIDITERIDLEKQKDDFMGIASHELKTPVTSIKAYTQILHEKFKKSEDTATTGILGRLDNQIDKLTSLINTLLDVARVQGGQMDYHPELFEIGKFMDELVEDVQRTTKHKIIAEVKLKGQLFADKSRIGQVLNNLISNAIKYSPNADRVILTVYERDQNVVFTVKDFGIGIPKDVQQQIFQRFFRVSEAAGNRTSGLGLGLYISAQIVRRQGGDIWVESEPGKGSLFAFSIPCDQKAN